MKKYFKEEDCGTVCANQGMVGSLSDLAPQRVVSVVGGTKKENTSDDNVDYDTLIDDFSKLFTRYKKG